MDSDLKAHKEMIKFYKLDNTESNTIVSTIKDVLQQLVLPISKCRGQCYDGARTMKGPRNGVVKQLLNDDPRAVLYPLYGHSLNLETVKGCKLRKDCLDIIIAVSKHFES